MMNTPCDDSSSTELVRMTAKLIAVYNSNNPTWTNMLRSNSRFFLLSLVLGRLPKVGSDGSSSGGMGEYAENAICALFFRLRKFHLISKLAFAHACKISTISPWAALWSFLCPRSRLCANGGRKALLLSLSARGAAQCTIDRRDRMTVSSASAEVVQMDPASPASNLTDGNRAILAEVGV